MKTAVKIDLKSFRYAFSDETVLENLEMEINYGEVTLLSGLSGSGKSTLISLINGIIPRVVQGEFDGKILIDGEETAGKSMSEISRKVGSVLQNAESQIIHQIVEDEIAFGCENFGFGASQIEKSITESCASLKLDRNWKTRTLSGGQKQRLVTASTLAMQGKILVFDEPLANLDLEGAKILLELLKKLAGEGRAVLLIEHRLDLVLPYADVVWNLCDKRAEKISDKVEFLKSQSDIISDSPENHLSFHETALEVQKIEKSFGKRKILDSVSFEVKKGERIMLLGENGSGKSTLLSIIARLLKADSGRVVQHFDEKLSERPCRKWFRLMGFVYQNPNYQLFMPSVKDEILFGTENSEESRTYALSLAEELGLSHLLDRHPHSLSEGQKRRVTICAILAQKPKLLLLDEPTVGQDYKTLEKMMAVLNRVHRESGNTMISISHDIRCISALCERKIELVAY